MTEDLRGKLIDTFLERVPKAPDVARQIGIDALSELFAIRTASYDEWWARNHYRYMKMREDDRARVRRALREFIADVSLGKVKVA